VHGNHEKRHIDVNECHITGRSCEFKFNGKNTDVVLMEIFFLCNLDFRMNARIMEWKEVYGYIMYTFEFKTT
jgi:hypothetical protein